MEASKRWMNTMIGSSPFGMHKVQSDVEANTHTQRVERKFSILDIRLSFSHILLLAFFFSRKKNRQNAKMRLKWWHMNKDSNNAHYWNNCRLYIRSKWGNERKRERKRAIEISKSIQSHIHKHFAGLLSFFCFNFQHRNIKDIKVMRRETETMLKDDDDDDQDG